MLVFVPHLFPPLQLLDALRELRLPALQMLLARSRREACPASGVETALCEALGIARQQDWPIAPITLQADGGTPGAAYWLRADPVHLRVMRDHIVLASEPLDLTQEEADALAAAMGAHFGDSLQPLPLHPQRWYLRLPETPALTTTPISVAAGRGIDPLLPHGAGAASFRAQLNEVQMLLHDHPVNLAREARGALPVNALWPWGGGTLPATPRQPLRIACATADQQAIARFAGATLIEGAPASAAADLAVYDTLAEAIQQGDLLRWRESVRQFDSSLSGWMRNQPELRVIDPIRGRSCHWQRTDRWKFWRKVDPLNLALGEDSDVRG